MKLMPQSQQILDINQLFRPCLQLELRSKTLAQRDKFRCFCIKLTSIEFPNSEVSNDSYCQCQMFLYNSQNQQFFGDPWLSKVKKKSNGKVVTNEAVYFYTSSCNQNIKLIIEIIETFQNSSECSNKTVAWAAVDLDLNENEFQQFNPLRIPFINGSPIALLSMGSIKGECISEEYCNGIEGFANISSHHSLMSILHLLPENFIFGADELMPGLYYPSESVLDRDVLLRPQLQKCITLVLSNLAMKTKPSLQKYEAEILNSLLEERQIMDETMTDLLNISVVQRSIQIGAHNTLLYIHEPDTHHMLIQPTALREDDLMVRSDIKIPNVPDDPNILIVFVIDYAISIQKQSDDVSLGTLGRHPSSTVTLLWGALPLSRLKSKKEIHVLLTNNPTSCPNKTLFLQPLTSHTFELTCTVTLEGAKRSAQSASVKTLSARSRSAKLRSSTPISNFALSVPNRLHQFSNKNFTFQRRSSSHSDLQVSEIPFKSPPASKNRNSSEKTDETTMEEVNVVPSTVPLVPAVVPMSLGYRLPRTVYTKLFSTKFPPIYDSKGQAPTVIDVTKPYNVNEAYELAHCLHGCKVVFQFLAISGLPSSNNCLESFFFTFQFYRFPALRSEKLFLKNVNGNNDFDSSRLFVLTTDPNEKQGLFGYQVSYYIDPSELSAKEYKPFLQSLVKGGLCIDLWESKSLMYFGTVLAPLKYLCRQNEEAVSATLELEISNSQFPDDAAGPNIPFQQLKVGLLHLRMAAIKMPLTPKSLEKLSEVTALDDIIVTAKSETKNDFQTAPITISKANPILDTNRELAKLLASRGSVLAPSGTSVLSEERRRKLARMDAVRNSLGKQSPITNTNDMQNYFLQRQQDLLQIESFIEKNKKNMIQTILQSSITTEKVLYPNLGQKTYFEFEVTNPFDSDQNIYFSWICPELSIVANSDQWQKLRILHGVDKKIENELPIVLECNNPAIFVRSKEKILVPFLYEHVSLDTSVYSEQPMKAASNHCFSSNMLSVASSTPSTLVKVSFCNREEILVAVLSLNVQILPPNRVTHFFRFLAPEFSTFQKAIVISDCHNNCPVVLCSDAEVTCESLPVASHRPKDCTRILIKTNTDVVGKVRIFYMFVYEDKHDVMPCQTWHVTVNPVQRIDLSCVAGQATRSSLILRGNHSSRLVCCYSDTNDIQLHPSDPFVQTSCTIQELALTIQSLIPGVGFFRVSMVDQNLEEMLRLWLIVIACQKPIVTKAFQVQLSLGSEAVKKITFNNRYSETKQFRVICSHPQLLQLKEQTFVVTGKKSHTIGLYFPDQHWALTETVFLYICDEFGKSEETFCIKVVCK